MTDNSRVLHTIAQTQTHTGTTAVHRQHGTKPGSDPPRPSLGVALVLLALMLIAARVFYLRARNLWRYGQQPRVILGDRTRERNGNA